MADPDNARMDTALRARFRWQSTLLVLVVGVAVGAVASQLVIHEDAPAVPRSLRYDSPDVVGLPMGDAIDRLVDAGYRVMAVGHGTVGLQEQGFRGSILRVQGASGARLRYCTARLPDCVPVDPGYRPDR